MIRNLSNNRSIYIIIITLLCGLLAGAVAFYQQKQSEQTISLDIISTIVPAEQESIPAISVGVDALQYNQTLALILDQLDIVDELGEEDEQIQAVSWSADLNSAILHARIKVSEAAEISNIAAEVQNVAQNNSLALAANHYDSTVIPKISLLSLPTTDSTNYAGSPYLISLLGLVVGYLIALVALPKKIT